jgi:selenocysteine lyase/cysteine desulfurase
MDRYDIPATARASLACFTNQEDLDVLARGLDKVRETFQ